MVTLHGLRSRPWLENKIDSFGFVRTHCDRLRRCAQLLVQGLNCVGARRQTAQIETAVLARHGKVWMFEHRHITPHPGMNVALYGDRYLCSRESFFRFGSVGRRLVPFAVVGGYRMDIVRSRIAVHYFQPLIRLHRQHVRLIHATLLSENDRLTRRVKSLSAQPVSNKHDYILQPAVCIGDHILTQNRSWMLFGATWVGRHVDGYGLWRCTHELDHTSESSGARGGITYRSGRTCLHSL